VHSNKVGAGYISGGLILRPLPKQVAVALYEGFAFGKRQWVAMLIDPLLPQAYDLVCARLLEAAQKRRVVSEVILQKAPPRLGGRNVARIIHLTLPVVLSAS